MDEASQAAEKCSHPRIAIDERTVRPGNRGRNCVDGCCLECGEKLVMYENSPQLSTHTRLEDGQNILRST